MQCGFGEDDAVALLQMRIPDRQIVRHFGFQLDDRDLKRAGMDYWRHVEWHRWKSWSEFEKALPPESRLWFVETKGPRLYTEVRYGACDHLVFGRETAGLPGGLLERHRSRWIRIPLFNSNARSLNLSNCVAVVLYEALRQSDFPSEIA